MSKITNKERFQIIEKLSNIHGVSGFEYEAQKTFKSMVEDSVDAWDQDNLGSLIAIRGNKGPKVMIAAHMDEIGFLVKDITKEGFIKIISVGGWWGHVLLSKPLIIHTRDGKEIRGVVGSTPPHILKPEQRSKVLGVEDVFVDVGAYSEKEVRDAGIKEGDWVSKDAKLFQGINKDWVCGKSLDDRACVAVLVEILKNLKNEELNCRLYATSTTQEEVGLRGAKTAAQHIKPDIAIALDVTIAKDTIGLSGGCKVGQGPAISLKDRGIVGNPKLIRVLDELAEKHGIKVQYDAMEGGATDAGTIHLVESGVITCALSLPSRYIHSHYEVVSLSDIEKSADLITEFIKGMSDAKFDELKNRRII